ncbi:hypothetical protein C1Y08_04830 [Pseudomonas sp. FW306-02-F02-AA]|uniref:DUF3077 domain-containing protein n=1 Tax=Pseudomonas fluorescens TaxID=294 RepID=A0A0N9WPV5_PSEFL|nr:MULTISPECIES: DUF6124 family protein [Pseudomonas]ALI04768.1 hypothetical protein AO353_28305 [Pseudomonas fluorescens]PMZ05488.1 hypothetical protein C1Y07_03355 [Pseudomonas sp. FW306-02-F02-AB]PMZ11057.1 hypothetical protein C1Y06_05140 [Pseudomonas sp. FW306-02-H06C]PMZ17013.1 hypothetical protein C1Y08_04830 [Pseudomonas sp. FW306-02-F02-AA]PMZ23258.1 hypothetical protein C1Y09_03435 [Pseudomonas sp. FW306-02-F08-AA]
MHKITPDLAETPSTSPYATTDSKKLHDAAERALDHYLKPPFDKGNLPDKRPSNIFAVIPDLDNETLLAHASETLASLNVLTSDLAFELEGTRRHVALAIQQMISLGELLVNRALDNYDQPEAP